MPPPQTFVLRLCVQGLGLARQRTSPTAVRSSALPDEPEDDGSSPANHTLGSRAQPAALGASMQQDQLCAAEPPAADGAFDYANGAHSRRCSCRSDG